jgi:hypothetical protein
LSPNTVRLAIERSHRIIDTLIGWADILDEEQFSILVRRLGIPRSAVPGLQAASAVSEGGYSAPSLRQILREALEPNGGDKLVRAIRLPLRAAIMGMTEAKVVWSAAPRNRK